MAMLKKILLVLILSLFGLTSHSRNVYVLVVGVADYPGTRIDLRLPVNDALSIANLYKTNENAVVKQLYNESATCANIVNGACGMYQFAEEDDIVVFYFSGHGFESGFCAYDGFLSYELIKEMFSLCKARHKMIFADSCFSGKLRDPKQSSTVSPQNIDLMLFLSSRHNEYSLERPQMKNGLFTTCLLRCLKGAADTNGDKVITAKELFIGVSNGVKILSQDQQHPVMWGNFDDDMTVISWRN